MTSATKTERNRATFYWLATALLLSELVLGGIWDVLRVPRVREVIERLGYPTYFASDHRRLADRVEQN